LNHEIKIDWGTIAKYDTGGFNSIAMDNSGHCIEVHVASLKLFYRVGTVNFDTQTIDWGTGTQYDTGRFNSIAMDNNGRCIEVNGDYRGNLFFRVGNVKECSLQPVPFPIKRNIKTL